MLDFNHLIILSANEGILPKTTLPASFIPYNLRFGFRLPTPEHQDAVFAYYFYRLLQRSRDIHILYTSGVKGMNGGEMSRFLYQIKYESGLTVAERNFQNPISTQNPKEIRIGKTPPILHILERYTRSEDQTISPSALNTYMECSLKFYFKYIAQIKEKEELAEELDHRLLGNIFHECSESLYATIPGGEITKAAIDTILANGSLIEEHIRRSYLKVYDPKISRLIDSGSNELILGVIKNTSGRCFLTIKNMSFPVAGYGEPFSRACKNRYRRPGKDSFRRRFHRSHRPYRSRHPGNRLQNRSRYDGFQNYRFGFRSGKSYPE